MEIAVKVLLNTVNGLEDEKQIGLVVYGHQKDDCKDVEFLVDAENGSKIFAMW